ncbi:transposase [Deinococcus roseus]|uniref:HTH psq-type domain-containing protein n=1 Tax=Deinococcus roseus TaxID=392414 RepID=A0ABQ2DJT8_9DEIO|nr:transposase [Deinococcus roseus]GGJ60124.1 hypothetical protein GCM10008938_52820 [Deinococcus roseus]
MTRRKTNTYTPEFKQEAVQLATREDMTIKQAAKDLGIPYSALHGWVQQTKTAKLTGRPVFTGKGKPALSEQEKRIKELEKEVEILRQEREILKLAAKFFAKEMP